MVLWCVLCFPSHLSDGQHHSGRSHRYQVRLLAVINHWIGLFGNIFTGNHGLCTWNLRGCPVNCPCLHQSIDLRWFLHFPIGKSPFEMENPFREYHIFTILSQVPFPALHQDCKVHERECNEQRERVKAKVKTGISLHLAIKNEKSPSHRPMTIGKAEQLMSYEISFTKNGPLGLSLNEEPGRMKVLKVKPQDIINMAEKTLRNNAGWMVVSMWFRCGFNMVS